MYCPFGAKHPQYSNNLEYFSCLSSSAQVGVQGSSFCIFILTATLCERGYVRLTGPRSPSVLVWWGWGFGPRGPRSQSGTLITAPHCLSLLIHSASCTELLLAKSADSLKTLSQNLCIIMVVLFSNMLQEMRGT